LASDHVLDVIAQVAPHRFQAIFPFADCSLHGFPAYIGRAHVAEVDEFLLVTDVVIECGIGQAEQVGNILERGAAVALEIETPRGRLEHAVTFEPEAGIDSVFGPGVAGLHELCT
jgi:hypothetical protein